MYEAKQNKERVSRVIGATGSGARQRVKMVDGRNTMQFYSERSNADVDIMWAQRQVLGIDWKSLPHNVAWCGGICAYSAVNAHSELRAILTDLASRYNGNINVSTERQPCPNCKSDLQAMEHHMAGNVNVHYLVRYTGNSQDKESLKEKYRNAGYI